MDFSLTAEQQELRAAVRAFATKEIAPSAEERSRNSRWDHDLWLKIGAQRWPGGAVPREYGGLGAGAIEHAIIVEEVSRADASLGGAVNVLQQTNMAVLAFSTEGQKQHYLPLLTSGRSFSITGITESDAGSKLTDMRTTAVRDGDHWVLDGAKTEVHIPEHVQLCLVFAKTGEAEISAFLVDTGTPGFKVGIDREIVGMRALPMSVVHFENCRIPADRLLGRVGGAYDVFFKSFDLTRIGNAAKCIGIAESAIEQAVAYARTRKIGDNVVTDFQGIRWQIADLATRLDGARWLMYKAAWEYTTRGRSTVDSAKAKLLACTAAMDATTIALQMTGSHGCFSENPFARYMMDAKVSQITGGTVEILRNTIARDVLGKPTNPTP